MAVDQASDRPGEAAGCDRLDLTGPDQRVRLDDDILLKTVDLADIRGVSPYLTSGERTSTNVLSDSASSNSFFLPATSRHRWSGRTRRASGMIILNHVPRLENDDNWKDRGHTYMVGYFKGMLRGIRGCLRCG